MIVSTSPTALTTVEPINGMAGGTLQPLAASACVPVAPAGVPPVKKRATWKRVKPPKDSRVYKAAMATIALRAQGVKYDDIASQLGLTKNTLMTYVKRAHRRGWINVSHFDDPEDRLEIVLKEKVIDNLHTVLKETMKREVKQGEDTVEIDTGVLSNRAVDVSLEIAKGTGLLKQHQVVKGEGGGPVAFALKVQVEMPPMMGGPVPVVNASNIGGQPFFDAEVVEE